MTDQDGISDRLLRSAWMDNEWLASSRVLASELCSQSLLADSSTHLGLSAEKISSTRMTLQ
jgi:hypothetical protein